MNGAAGALPRYGGSMFTFSKYFWTSVPGSSLICLFLSFHHFLPLEPKRSISVYNHHIPVMYIHSEDERERRQSENFLSPSPARGILHFYWTFEMVRVWSYDPVGQWYVVLGKLCGGKSFNMVNSLDDLN